ncbi:MAG TPA: SRPBCC domain-containing protein [Gemmatimonadales bacterium]|nr:SRPBCC domain-containing protein [Gemmatimonadales bacterium]
MTGVTLIRRIRARPSIVFDALSTPEGLTRWWGPDDLPVIAAEADARVGGAFRVRFPTADGHEHECAGEFLEIQRPERIILSWRWTVGGTPEEQGRTSRVEFWLRPIGDGTELTLIHTDLRDESSARDHGGGWGGALTKLARIYTMSGDAS